MMSFSENYPYNQEDEKVYFLPGDRVTIKHDIPNKPVMLVKSKEQRLVRADGKSDKDNHFKGIRCFWFTSNQELQESVFNTKDLQKI